MPGLFAWSSSLRSSGDFGHPRIPPDDFHLEGFNRNLRNEVTRNSKVYFHGLGVRNVAMGDFRSFAARQDQGALWENFLIAERRAE